MVADEEDGGDMWGLLFWPFLSLESLGWESLFQQGLGGISSLPLAHRHMRKCVRMHAHPHVHTHICVHTLSPFSAAFFMCIYGVGGVDVSPLIYKDTFLFPLSFFFFLPLFFKVVWVTLSVGVFAVDIVCICVCM